MAATASLIPPPEVVKEQLSAAFKQTRLLRQLLALSERAHGPQQPSHVKPHEEGERHAS